VVSAPFRRHVRCYSMAKPDLSSSLWTCHCVFFHMVWSVMAYGERIVTGGLFSFFSLSYQIECMIVLFVFLFFNFSPHSFDFLLCSYSFYRSFVFSFQFSPSITISHMFFFSFWSLFFFLALFLKFFLALNFIFQSKFFRFYFFQFKSHSFDLFFLLLNLFFFNSI
jgi:hypothetical protein